MSERSTEEEERVKNMIRQYAGELEEKMNFRLLLDQENKDDRCFFVEYIGVTDIFFPRKAEEKKTGGRIRAGMAWLFRRIRAGIRRLFSLKKKPFYNSRQ